MKLYWKKLKHNAIAPTCANPGEDLAYDLYACERVMLTPGRTSLVSTGVAIEFDPPHGAIIKDRSSMALKGIKTAAGVIDAGYRGEVNVLMTLDMDPPPRKTDPATPGMRVPLRKVYVINPGDKIAQFVPVKPLTLFDVEESEVLTETKRGDGGFGSTGK